MIAARHSVAGRGRPYDYRVAYFQRISSGYDTARFLLPSIDQMNPAVHGAAGAGAALKSSEWAYSVTCGFAPGSTLTGDRKVFGVAEFVLLAIINNVWRVGGMNAWYPGFHDTIPLTTGNAVEVTLNPSGYVARSSDGGERVVTSSHSEPVTSASLPVLYSVDGPTRYVAVGGRFFGCSLHNDHPVYGFDADYICVMNDGAPYIYDRASDLFCPNIGGDALVVGPKVADNWNPMQWEEPA